MHMKSLLLILPKLRRQLIKGARYVITSCNTLALIDMYNKKPQIMHELEIEFARSSVLLSTAAVRGSENVPPIERDAFDELVRAFVNNVRILVRNTRPPV